MSDAARLALASATGLVFADSKAFDAWWQENRDTHHHVWYWATRCATDGEIVEADLPALVDAMGPQTALKTMFLANLPASINIDMLAHQPDLKVSFYRTAVKSEVVMKFVREHSLQPLLLEILRQEQPWPDVKPDEGTQIAPFGEVLNVLKIVATRADAPAIQSVLENPASILTSRSDLQGELSMLLASLDRQRLTEVLLAQFRRNPKQASVAVQIIGATGLKHWDAIEPATKDYHVRRDLLSPIGRLRTNQAAAILGKLLAGERLIPGGRGDAESYALAIFQEYVRAATLLNDSRPVVAEDLVRRATARPNKSTSYEEGEQWWRQMPAARAEAIKQLKKFFADCAAAKDKTSAAPAGKTD